MHLTPNKSLDLRESFGHSEEIFKIESKFYMTSLKLKKKNAWKHHRCKGPNPCIWIRQMKIENETPKKRYQFRKFSIIQTSYQRCGNAQEQQRNLTLKIICIIIVYIFNGQAAHYILTYKIRMYEQILLSVPVACNCISIYLNVQEYKYVLHFLNQILTRSCFSWITVIKKSWWKHWWWLRFRNYLWSFWRFGLWVQRMFRFSLEKASISNRLCNVMLS